MATARQPVFPLTNQIDLFLPDLGDGQPGVQGLVPPPPPGSAAADFVLTPNGWANPTTLPNAGGANQQIQYNNAGFLGGIAGSIWDGANFTLPNLTVKDGIIQSNISANKSAYASTGYSLTGTNAQNLIDLAGTWNTTGNPTGIKVNITNTASGATSLLMDLQVGATSQFKVSKAGVATTVGNVVSGGNVSSATGLFLAPSAATLNLSVDGQFTFSNNAVSNATTISIPANNIWQFGALDSAAPTAQTVGFSNVVGGTSNTAGVNSTIRASAGTGNALSGSLLFQVAPAGSSGTTQNTFVTLFSIGAQGSPSAADHSLGFLGVSANNLWWTNNVFGATPAQQWTLMFNNSGIAFLTNTPINTLSMVQPLTWAPDTNSAPDLYLLRKGAANLQIGAADAATATAQVFSMQSVVAGTSNVAGADFTLKGSIGTGTGAGGKLIFQTAPAGASGTSQNALATGLIITAPAVNMQPSCVLGNQALATNATDGFLYICSGAGTPTGTPTTFTGRVPMYIDTTNSQLWLFLGGAWKQPKTPAGAALVTWQ